MTTVAYTKRPKWFKTKAVALALLFTFLWLLVSPAAAFFWTVFILWWRLRLDTRFLAGAALVFLCIIPVLLAVPLLQGLAELFATYVYFLLVITVAVEIMEFWRSGRAAEAPAVEPERSDDQPADPTLHTPPLPAPVYPRPNPGIFYVIGNEVSAHRPLSGRILDLRQPTLTQKLKARLKKTLFGGRGF